MGMYDVVRVDSQFRCSEGHDLSGEEFQTKDFGETFGDISVSGTSIIIQPGKYGYPPKRPLLGRFVIYGSCRKCPAFVQADTFNVVECWVEFELEVVDNVVRAINMESPTTAEFLKNMPKETWMEGCHGPMSYEEAVELHIEGLASKVNGNG